MINNNEPVSIRKDYSFEYSQLMQHIVRWPWAASRRVDVIFEIHGTHKYT